jgi:hypothetical protein
METYFFPQYSRTTAMKFDLIATSDLARAGVHSAKLWSATLAVASVSYAKFSVEISVTS